MSNPFPDERLSRATSEAYEAIHRGAKGNGREIASCVATLFVDTMRLLGVPDDDALDALRYTYAAIKRRPTQ